MSFVQFLSIQYHFSVDRQLDTSGHVLEEVGMCERLSEDLFDVYDNSFCICDRDIHLDYMTIGVARDTEMLVGLGPYSI